MLAPTPGACLGQPAQQRLPLYLTQMGRVDTRARLPPLPGLQHGDRPVNVMIPLQQCPQFLLCLLPGQPADPLGQGWGGVVGDNAQSQFSGERKGRLVIIAGLLQRFVQTTLEFDGAEQGGDAAPVEAFLVLRGT